MDLLELLTELTLRKLREAIKTPAHYIKLWENLAIEMIGPRHYRRQIAPMYRQILDILSPAGKRLIVHYDGKLRMIADDIAQLDLNIDSLTPAPEGQGLQDGTKQFSQRILLANPSSAFPASRPWGEGAGNGAQPASQRRF